MKLLLSKAVSQKMKNREYWQKRFEELEDRRMKEAAAYYRDVEKQFRRAQNRIEKDMERWYQRLADNQGIGYAAAKRLLNKKELAEFQWTLEEYIKRGKENAVSSRWLKELENASAKVHITHLEGMKTAIQQYNEVLFAQLKEGLTGHLSKVAEESFYRNAYEIAKGTGIGRTVPYFDSKKLEIILNQTWAADGTKFSDRIWNNKQKLVRKLHTELTQSIIRGEAPDKAIQRLAKEMKVSEKQAGRLIMTETAAISSAADLESYQELGIKKYQILATLDNKTSLICQDMDHKVFDIKDYQVGMTAPPFHPYCRTTTIPYFEDEFTIGEQRTAKDEGTGKTYYVPASISYKEWKKNYIRESDLGTFKKKIISDKRMGKEYYSMIKEKFSHGSDIAKKVFAKYVPLNSIKNAMYEGTAFFDGEYIYMHYYADLNNIRGKGTTWFHEHGHMIDQFAGNISIKNDNFFKALIQDFVYNTVQKEYIEIETELCDMRKHSAVSDLFHGLSKEKINGCATHPRRRDGTSYWNDKLIVQEAFAHMFECQFDKIRYEEMKKYFPTALKEFEKILGEL